jgi:hypothetical protein
MAIARYIDGQVVDRREDVDIEAVPVHKRTIMGWKSLVYTGSGPLESVSVSDDTITIARSNHPLTVDHVKAEAQRRIVLRTGVSDLTQCVIRQLNANMRANELNDIRHTRAWTTEEAAEAEVLRTLAADIKAIRAKSNVIEATNPIPMDYAADSRWTG